VRREEQIGRIARNCVYFKGDRPCRMHMRTGATCRCEAFCPRSGKLLLVQLSSAATVIRSNAVVRRFKHENPDLHITYASPFGHLLSREVDEVVFPDAAGLMRVQMDHFDMACNLDTHNRACALMNTVNAETKCGFYLRQGDCVPLDRAAQMYYLRQMLPALYNNDRPGKVHELFQLCGLQYQRDAVILTVPTEKVHLTLPAGPVVGLFTGLDSDLTEDCQATAGKRWDVDNWLQLTELAGQDLLVPYLLVLERQDRFSRQLTQNVSLNYSGALSRREILEAVNQCYVVVTTAQWMLELALAYGKAGVYLQPGGTIDGLKRIDMPLRGVVVEPSVPGDTNQTIDAISPREVMVAIHKQIGRIHGRKPQVAGGVEAVLDDFCRDQIRRQVSSQRRGPMSQDASVSDGVTVR